MLEKSLNRGETYDKMNSIIVITIADGKPHRYNDRVLDIGTVKC